MPPTTLDAYFPLSDTGAKCVGGDDPKRKSRPQANRFSSLNRPMIIAFVSDVALSGTSIIEEDPEHP